MEKYIQVPKMVVASVVDGDGNQVYPRKWNHDFIDMPVVELPEQNRPSFSSEIMTGLARYPRLREQMLFAVAGAGGLRVGEALGIEIDKRLSADCLTIAIMQKARHGRVENRVKTRSARRQVDLYPDVAKLLKGLHWDAHQRIPVPDRERDTAVADQRSSPPSASGTAELGYVNSHTGDHKAGTHAFRRFRNTYLKNETSCPKGLRDYGLGHAGNSMDDLFDMVKDNATFRKQKAAEYGIGFELPISVSVVPNVPKSTMKSKPKKAVSN